MTEFYDTLLITQKEFVRAEISLDNNLKEIKCLKVEMTQNKGVVLTVNKNNKKTGWLEIDDLLVIQIFSDNKQDNINENRKEIIIYNDIYERSKVVFSKIYYTNNFSYVLNSSLVNDTFDIALLTEKNMNNIIEINSNNNIIIEENICIQKISSKKISKWKRR